MIIGLDDIIFRAEYLWSRKKKKRSKVRFTRGHVWRGSYVSVWVPSKHREANPNTKCYSFHLSVVLCSPPRINSSPSSFFLLITKTQTFFLNHPTQLFIPLITSLEIATIKKIVCFYSFIHNNTLKSVAFWVENWELWQGLMGNCLDSSAKVDAAQSSRSTSGWS